MQQDMDTILESELVEGELLLWFSRPDPKNRSTTSPGFVFMLLSIIFGLLGVAMLVVATILLVALQNQDGRDAAIALFSTGGPFLFVALLFVIFIFVYRYPATNMLYAITDQRAVIMRTGRLLTVDSYFKTDISQMRRVERHDGTGDLIFMSTRSAFGYGSGYSYGGYSNYGASMNGLASAGRFTGISEVRKVEQILRGALK